MCAYASTRMDKHAGHCWQDANTWNTETHHCRALELRTVGGSNEWANAAFSSKWPILVFTFLELPEKCWWKGVIENETAVCPSKEPQSHSTSDEPRSSAALDKNLWQNQLPQVKSPKQINSTNMCSVGVKTQLKYFAPGSLEEAASEVVATYRDSLLFLQFFCF